MAATTIDSMDVLSVPNKAAEAPFCATMGVLNLQIHTI